MWKKRWIVVPVTLVALALGVTGGVAMAQESEGDSPLQSFASRVASILGIDEQQVEDALEQASREMRDEAVQQKLNSQVESGWITQEQADEYLEWYQARPSTDGPKFGGPGRGGFGHRHGHRGGGLRFRSGTPAETAPAPEGAAL